MDVIYRVRSKAAIRAARKAEAIGCVIAAALKNLARLVKRR